MEIFFDFQPEQMDKLEARLIRSRSKRTVKKEKDEARAALKALEEEIKRLEKESRIWKKSGKQKSPGSGSQHIKEELEKLKLERTATQGRLAESLRAPVRQDPQLESQLKRQKPRPISPNSGCCARRLAQRKSPKSCRA